jgi:hypothetical protein
VPRWQSLAFQRLRSLNTVAAGMAEAAEAVSMAEVAVVSMGAAVEAATSAGAGATLISAVAGVPVEGHHAHFQGLARAETAALTRGRSA